MKWCLLSQIANKMVPPHVKKGKVIKQYTASPPATVEH